MGAEKVEINSQGIRRVLKSFQPAQSIAEYIWNGFDAGASVIRIEYKAGKIPSGGLDYLKISDDGHGINQKDLTNEFKPFFVSKKHKQDERQKTTLPHGKKGYGRLTFFVFAQKAYWTTTFCTGLRNATYSIEISAKTLGQYDNSEPQFVDTPTGTTVEFSDIHLTVFQMSEVEKYLQDEFAFFLEMNRDKGFSIYINGQLLHYDLLVLNTATNRLFIADTKFEFRWNIVQWASRNNEFSNIYLIDSQGNEIYKTTTKLNRKGDSFLHSVYIYSNFFDDFVIYDADTPKNPLGLNNSNKDDVYRHVIEMVDSELRVMRKPFLHNRSLEIITMLEKEKVFPEYNSSHPLEKFRHDELVNIVREIYIAEPRLFNDLNIEQKKIFVRFLDVLLASNARDDIFNILDSIINLDQEDVKRLGQMIVRSSLENIINTIQIIEDRIKVVEDLKLLVFNKNINADERNHLQKLIEQHYWIVGEQYNLVTAEEPDFEEALRRYRYTVYGEEKVELLESEDKQKEMDIFAIRQNKLVKNTEHIVIELKHPNINLGEKELSQLKRYSRVIMSDDRFNASNMKWSFYLMGNGFTQDGYVENEIRTNKNHGEEFLIQSLDNVKIYIIRWSEIITALENKFAFILDKLQAKRQDLVSKKTSATEIVRENLNISASMPPQVQLPAKPRRRRS